MKVRDLGYLVGVAALVVVLWIGFEGAFDRRDPLPGPDVEATETTEPPPDFGPEPSTRDRIAWQLSVWIQADIEDAQWAQEELAAGGPEARAAVLHAAEQSLTSNLAFVEHALDFFLRAPGPDAAPLAREALSSRDPHVVTRAATLLARIGGDTAREALRDLAEAAIAREHPVPQYAMDALAKIGGDAARAEALRAARGMDADPENRVYVYLALARLGGDDVRAYLRERFHAETDPRLLFPAAEALLAMEDETPVPWLVEQLGAGSEPALQVLARFARPEALPVVAARLARDLELQEMRIGAVQLLEKYTLREKEALLREAAMPDSPRELRVEAWDQLVRSGAAGAREQVLEMLRASSREDRYVAALVVGRMRDPLTAAALLRAHGEAGKDTEMRSLYLRAAVLSGSPDAAEAVARAMAGDTTPYFDPESISFWIVQVLDPAPEAFRIAMAPHIVRALRGEFGEPSGSGLLHLIGAAAKCCGPEAAPVLEPLLEHEDRLVREAVAQALARVGGPTSPRALRAAWRRQDPYTRLAIGKALERLHYRTPRAAR